MYQDSLWTSTPIIYYLTVLSEITKNLKVLFAEWLNNSIERIQRLTTEDRWSSQFRLLLLKLLQYNYDQPEPETAQAGSDRDSTGWTRASRGSSVVLLSQNKVGCLVALIWSLLMIVRCTKWHQDVHSASVHSSVICFLWLACIRIQPYWNTHYLTPKCTLAALPKRARAHQITFRTRSSSNFLTMESITQRVALIELKNLWNPIKLLNCKHLSSGRRGLKKRSR